VKKILLIGTPKFIAVTTKADDLNTTSTYTHNQYPRALGHPDGVELHDANAELQTDRQTDYWLSVMWAFVVWYGKG
jgi:hypothetical protein